MERLDILKKDDAGDNSTRKKAGTYEGCPYFEGVLRTSRFWGQLCRNQSKVRERPSENATFGS